MQTSTIEVNKLLDKLYNFRGSDSVIFKEMETLHQKAEETKNRTTEEKSALQDKIALLKEDSTFCYSDPTGIKETGIAKISNFSKDGYSINKIAYTMNTTEANIYNINNKSVSEEEYNSFMNEQNSKNEIVWNKY